MRKLHEQDAYKEKPEFARDLAIFVTGVLNNYIKLDATEVWEAVNKHVSTIPGAAGTYAFNKKLASGRVGADTT